MVDWRHDLGKAGVILLLLGVLQIWTTPLVEQGS